MIAAPIRRSPELLDTLHAMPRGRSRVLFAGLSADEHRALVAYVAALVNVSDLDAARWIHATFGPRPRFLARRDEDGGWCALDSLTAQIVLSPFPTRGDAERLCHDLEQQRED